MTFTSSLQMVALMACLLFTFSAETAAESGTITINGCRLQPLYPPPTTSNSERCPWYLNQINACGRISPAETAASALETYTRKANELGCRGAGPGLASSLLLRMAFSVLAYLLTWFN